MKTRIINHFFVRLLVLVIGLSLPDHVEGQNFKTLHSFGGTEGEFPVSGLLSSGNNLFGTTALGGASKGGTVFAINLDGSGYKVLYSFSGSPLSPMAYPTNNDGASPNRLISSGNTLYGTAATGGAAAHGTVFSVGMDGTAFTVLHQFSGSSTNSSGVFTNADGSNPAASLVLSGDTLCGTAVLGGSFGSGTIFSVKTNGTGFSLLHHFEPKSNFGNRLTNTDGANPIGALVQDGKRLYGCATEGGFWGGGTLFVITGFPRADQWG